MNLATSACVAALIAAVLAGPARADDPESGTPRGEPAQPEPSRPPAASPPAALPPTHVPSNDLDFDLLGKPKEQANPALEHDIAKRRTMLTLHPAFGIATWAALAATTIVGQLDFNDRFRGGGDTGKYHAWHTGLAIGSAALFETTLLLAWLAPKPFPTPAKLDTALLHKVAMGVATAGMLTQLVLGIVARGQAGSVTERNLAAVHQLVGYTTFAAYTVGVTVLVF